MKKLPKNKRVQKILPNLPKNKRLEALEYNIKPYKNDLWFDMIGGIIVITIILFSFALALVKAGVV